MVPMSRRRLVTGIVAAVVLTPLVVGGVFLLWLWVGMSGGLDDAFRFDRPQAGDPEVVAAQEAAAGPFREAVRHDTERVVLPVVSGSALLGSAELPPDCTEGQHNWKRDDDFDLVCDLPVIEVVSVPGKAGFRDDMVRLDVALRAQGWAAQDSFGMDRVLTGYWDELAEPGAATTAGSYSMDDLPGTRYSRQVDGREHTVSIDWAEQGSGEHVLGYGLDGVRFRTPSRGDLAPRALLREVPAEGYAVVLTHRVEYFRQ